MRNSKCSFNQNIRYFVLLIFMISVSNVYAREDVSVRFPLYNPVTDSLVDNAVHNCTPIKAMIDGKDRSLLGRHIPYRDSHIWMNRYYKHRGYFEIILYSGFEYDLEISALKQGEPVMYDGAHTVFNELDSRFKPIKVHVDLRDTTKFVKDEKNGETAYFMPKMYFEPKERITIRGHAIDGMSERELDGFRMEIYNLRDSSLVGESKIFRSEDGKKFVNINMPLLPIKYGAKFIATKEEKIDEYRSRYVDNPAYAPEWVDFNLGVIPEGLKTSTLPTAYLRKPSKINQLNEVTVTASKIMFYHKGDTLVYNADAFVLAEGSTLDALINQLPGVTLNSNGVIYCNGKRVDNLLLNGKDLFNGNHKLMLENLPYYTVKDIAVYDKAGHDSELMGMKVAGDTKHVMDVRLKRQYSMGWLLNAEAGYGTHDRYLAKLFAMWFSDNVSIMAHAGANNLSDTSTPGQKDGAWSRDKMGEGVVTRQSGGLSYTAAGQASKWELKGSADVEHQTTDTRTSTVQTNFLSSGDTYRYRWDNDTDEKLKVNTSHTFFFKLGTRANLTVLPKFDYEKTKREGNSTDATFNAEVADISRSLIENIYSGADGLTELLLNRRLSETLTNGQRLGGTFSARSTIRTKSTGQKNSLTLSASAGYDNNRRDRFNRYWLNFGEDAAGTFRSQYFKEHPSYDWTYNASAKFIQYLNWRNSQLPVTYDFTRREQTRTSSLYYLNDVVDFDATNAGIGVLPSQSQYLSTIDAAQSYASELIDNRHSLTVQYNLTNSIPLTKKPDCFRFGFQAFAKMVVADRSYDYLRVSGAPVMLKRTSVSADYRLSLVLGNYGSKKNQCIISLAAIGRSSLTQMRDMLEVINNTDPLNISLGNPNLRNPYSHNLNFSVNFSNREVKHDFSLNGTLFTNQVARSAIYNTQTGVRTIKPYNVDGNALATVSYSLFHRFGRLKAFDISSRTSGNFARSVDLSGVTVSNENAFDVIPSRRIVNTWSIDENLKLNWTIGKHRVSAFGEVKWNLYRSHEVGFKNFNAFNSNCGLSGVFNFPYNWSIGTDISLYTRRGYTDKVLNTTDLIWNARVSKSILKGSLTFVLDGYDLLQQLNNITYTVNAQARTEAVSNVIPSYLLFHIQYRFSHNPKR